MADCLAWWLRRNLRTTFVVTLGAICATATPSRAVEFWSGAASTDWFDAANWLAAVPTNSTSTRIDTVTPNATVIGAAGALSTGLRVGVSGTGTLTIQNGGTVNNTLGIIGDQAGSTGTATVNGAGSRWTNSSDFYVGSGGSGTLTIQNGGAVSNVHGFVGNFSGATGVATVDGAGSTWTNSGDLQVGIYSNGTLIIRNGGTVSNGFGYIAQYAGATGAVTVDGAGSTWINRRDLSVGGAYGAGIGTLTIRNGGVVSTGGGGYVAADIGSTGTVTVDGAGSTWTNSGSLTVGNLGSGTLTIRNGGVVSASGMSIADQAGSTGALNIGAATGQAAAAPGTLNTASVDFGDGTGQIVFNHTATNYIFSPIITSFGAGTGTVRVEAGTTILTAASTYTGPTVIDGGRLSVNGSIAGSSVTVNAGGALGGNGTVGNTIVNGGTLAPGNSTGALTVNGNLSFTAASSYMVMISPANADRTNVTGTATLGAATVKANFATGTNVARQYAILNATGGLGGSTFGSITTNLPSGFTSSLSYDANHAYLNIAWLFVVPSNTSLDGNQTSVANTLVGAFNRNGSIPLAFGGLSPAGLTQAAGLVATAVQPTVVQAMTPFMTTLTDLSAAGRGFDAPGAIGFANDGDAVNDDAAGRKNAGPARDAFDMIAKAALRGPIFESRGRVWAQGFGGGQTTDGNTAIGSSTASSRIYGMAAGVDYWLSQATAIGFALAGGGTNFRVAAGGSGRSDLFQAGSFIRHTAGSAYVSAAAAYGWHDVTTDRTVTVAGIDQLRGSFTANAFSGRIEGGDRFMTPWFGGLGLTPYAAAQVTTTHLPGYAETAVSGVNTFALSYQAKNVTAPRTELGLRGDKSFAMADALLTLRGRAAWAHDFNPTTAASATFQALPGASFVVNGAAAAHDAALTTASAEMKWSNGISFAATFEGEFSPVTRSYAGKGVAGYAW
ncbi:MAG: autotransporter domain-containing protein [Bradyrhizobium sp.]